MCVARYEDGGRWPITASGFGNSLELKDPHYDPRCPENWQPSRRVGGTPGGGNTRNRAFDRKMLIEAGDDWKYFEGDRDPPRRWTQRSFNDRSWNEGPSPLGYGYDDIETEVRGRRKSISLFIRKSFRVQDPEKLQTLILRVSYDDGFAAYLNGKEVARGDLGNRGQKFSANEPSTGRSDAGVATEFQIDAKRFLDPGRNVLAIQVHNRGWDSRDLSIMAELENRQGNTKSQRSVVLQINEIAIAPDPSRDRGFIEIFNPSFRDIRLAGYFLTDDPLAPKRFKIAESVEIKAGRFVALSAKELGPKFNAAHFQSSKGAIVAALLAPDGERVIDAFRWKNGTERSGEKMTSFGRFPDGAHTFSVGETPTRGEANARPNVPAVIINEIMYHPISDDPDDTYVELHNPSTNAVDLSGFHFDRGITYRFPDGTRIQPGEFLVIARNPVALISESPLSDALGPYLGSLSNSSETIRLNTALDQPLFSFRYQSKGHWPASPDGTGHSLVRANLSGSPRQAGNWTASDRLGGSPGAAEPGDHQSEDSVRALIKKGSIGRYFKGTKEHRRA